MKFTGTVQGAPARKYSGFTYRTPFYPPIHFVPEESEYTPCETVINTADCADFEVVIKSKHPRTGLHALEVAMLPNRHTPATERMVVHMAWVAHPSLYHNLYVHEAMKISGLTE